MDASYNPTHHVQVGSLVMLRNLSRTGFNGRQGTVLGFRPDKARFAVRLIDDVHPKLFKGKNLQLIPNDWTAKHNDFHVQVDNCKSLKEVFAMKIEIEENMYVRN